MKSRFQRALVLVLFCAAALQAAAQGTAFTYQGELSDNSQPANGAYDLRFIVYDAESGGSQKGGTLTNSGVAANDGLFVVTLDFGLSAFNDGGARWLEIAVCTNGGTTFITLSPRQSLSAAPYAVTAGNLTGTLPATQLSGVLPSGLLSGAYSGTVTFNNTANNFNGAFNGNGAGLTNLNAATLGGQTAATFWQLGGNSGATPGTLLGPTDNQPLELRVNGQRALRLEPTGDGVADLDSVPDGAWRYTNEVAGVRGTSVPPFHAAFKVGTDDKTIGTVDANGVALAAVQGLHQKLEEEVCARDTRIAELEKQNRSLERRLEALERLLAAPAKAVSAAAPSSELPSARR